MAKKKITTQVLKDRLWKMVDETDFGTGDCIDDHEDYNKWETDYIASGGNPVRKVEGFSATTVDIGKIRHEVDGSCLTDECKKTLLASLKNAK